MDEILYLIRAYCQKFAPGEVSYELRIKFLSGRVLVHPIPHGGIPVRQPPYSHSSDFRSVRWFGVDYTFSPTQAAIIRQLWQAWEDGVPELGTATLLEGAGSECERIPPLFQGNPAWGVMVVKGEGKGTFRLEAPAFCC